MRALRYGTDRPAPVRHALMQSACHVGNPASVGCSSPGATSPTPKSRRFLDACRFAVSQQVVTTVGWRRSHYFSPGKTGPPPDGFTVGEEGPFPSGERVEEVGGAGDGADAGYLQLGRLVDQGGRPTMVWRRSVVAAVLANLGVAERQAMLGQHLAKLRQALLQGLHGARVLHAEDHVDMVVGHTDLEV